MNNNHMVIKEDRKLVYLHNDEVLFIKATRDYMKVFTPGRRHITHCTIKRMAEAVDSSVFARVHRSYIVNLTKVEGLQDNVIIVNGTSIPVSKPYRDIVANKISHLKTNAA